MRSTDLRVHLFLGSTDVEGLFLNTVTGTNDLCCARKRVWGDQGVFASMHCAVEVRLDFSVSETGFDVEQD